MKQNQRTPAIVSRTGFMHHDECLMNASFFLLVRNN